jgi:hypothetical protein
MEFRCEQCNKLFRDNYNLRQHLEKKKPCKAIVIINPIRNESLSPDLPEQIISFMRESLALGGEPFDYIRAVKWISELHTLICKNPLNQNVKLKSTKSMSGEMLTDRGWVTKHTNNLLEEIFKIRSSQLIRLKESINNHNTKVLANTTIKRTMSHVSSFERSGFGYAFATRQARAEFKVALTAGYRCPGGPIDKKKEGIS